MSTRQHEFTIDIDASPEEIWQALTEGEGIRKWFAPEASVTPGLGGSITLSWGEGCEGTAPIHLWEPKQRFGWTEGAKLVEIEIETAAGGFTRLRLVHSGFGAESNFDQEYDSTQAGWQCYLAMLKHSAERYAGIPATHVHVLKQFPESTDAIWGRLTGPAGVAIDSLTEGQPYRANLGGIPIQGAVIRYVKPGYLCLDAAESIVALFVEKAGEGSMQTVQWILYGEARSRAERVKAALTALVAEPPPRSAREAAVQIRS